MKSKLLIATALTALTLGTGLASAQQKHSPSNLAPGETDRLNRGKVQPDEAWQGTWPQGRYYNYRRAPYAAYAPYDED